jgi:hypothetical protein
MEIFGGNFWIFSILTQVSDFRNYCQTNIGFDSIVGKRTYYVGIWKSDERESQSAYGLLEIWQWHLIGRRIS